MSAPTPMQTHDSGSASVDSSNGIAPPHFQPRPTLELDADLSNVERAREQAEWAKNDGLLASNEIPSDEDVVQNGRRALDQRRFSAVDEELAKPRKAANSAASVEHAKASASTQFNALQ